MHLLPSPLPLPQAMTSASDVGMPLSADVSLLPLPTGAKNTLYKTEHCKHFMETGSCRYGNKCQFAHGEHELRNVARHPKYKTTRCKAFASTGLCPYGARCRFLHNEEPTAFEDEMATSFGLVHPAQTFDVLNRSLLFSICREDDVKRIQSSSSSQGSLSPLLHPWTGPSLPTLRSEFLGDLKNVPGKRPSLEPAEDPILEPGTERRSSISQSGADILWSAVSPLPKQEGQTVFSVPRGEQLDIALKTDEIRPQAAGEIRSAEHPSILNVALPLNRETALRAEEASSPYIQDLWRGFDSSLLTFVGKDLAHSRAGGGSINPAGEGKSSCSSTFFSSSQGASVVLSSCSSPKFTSAVLEPLPTLGFSEAERISDIPKQQDGQLKSSRLSIFQHLCCDEGEAA